MVPGSRGRGRTLYRRFALVKHSEQALNRSWTLVSAFGAGLASLSGGPSAGSQPVGLLTNETPDLAAPWPYSQQVGRLTPERTSSCRSVVVRPTGWESTGARGLAPRLAPGLPAPRGKFRKRRGSRACCDTAPAPEEETRGNYRLAIPGTPRSDERRRDTPIDVPVSLRAGRTSSHGTSVPAPGITSGRAPAGTSDWTWTDQSSGILIQPWRIAYTTAWVRSLTDSFRRIDDIWFLTVCSLIDSA
jgi:hypothetical protein